MFTGKAILFATNKLPRMKREFSIVISIKGKNGRKKRKVSHKELLEELRNGTADSFRKMMHGHWQPHFDT